MGVTNIRYLLSQWRCHWETLAALQPIDPPEPDPSRIAPGFPRKPQDEQAPTFPEPRGLLLMKSLWGPCEVYGCDVPGCRSRVLVLQAPADVLNAPEVPRCVCGGPLIREGSVAAVTESSFLNADPAAAPSERQESG